MCQACNTAILIFAVLGASLSLTDREECSVFYINRICIDNERPLWLHGWADWVPLASHLSFIYTLSLPNLLIKYVIIIRQTIDILIIFSWWAITSPWSIPGTATEELWVWMVLVGCILHPLDPLELPSNGCECEWQASVGKVLDYKAY